MEVTKLQLQKSIDVIKGGGIIIFPTDTAFGIGCRIDDKNAVDRLFDLRKRPRTQATPVLVSSIDMALAYLDSPTDIVRHLMKIYWPGALTIIAQSIQKHIYSPIRGGGKNIGVRMPAHVSALQIIREVGVPILGPSANFHGYPTPFVYENLDPQLVKLVDYVLPGTCKQNTVSTVIDCSVAPFQLVRQGAVIVNTVLFIDSSRINDITVAIEFGGLKYERNFSSKFANAQMVLPVIEELIHMHKLTIGNITHIKVHTGPGSFTGLRVGLAVANMLSTILNVPINGQPPGTPLILTYA